MEKLSYALGLIIGNNLKGMNIEGLITGEFTRAVEQVLNGDKLEVTEVQAAKTFAPKTPSEKA